MNKQGQVTMLYTLMIAIVVILFAMAVAPTLKIFNDEARGPSTDTSVGLDCNNASISDYDKANCVALDLNFPFVILGFMAVAGIIIGARVMFG